MIKAAESKYIDETLEIHEFEFGNFYFSPRFLIAEIAEDASFDWKKAEKILNLANQIYPEDFAPYYVSNKINSYAVDPTIWVNVLKLKRKVKAYIIVKKTRIARVKFLFEQKFFKGVIKKFPDLDNAIT